jgi:lipoprotein NlpD
MNVREYSRRAGWIAAAAAALIAAGCVSTRPAPVTDRTPTARQSAQAPASAAKPSAAPRPVVSSAEARDSYTVKPGDTLYSIALEHGVDYRELALWNGLDNPGALRMGQTLRVTPPTGTAVAAPLKVPAGSVQGKPIGTGPAPAAVPLPPSAGTSAVVSEPKGVRLPYSEQALAQLSKAEAAPPARVVEAPRPEARAESPRPDTSGDAARGPEDLDWAWPVRGKIISTFNDTTSKGIAIAGRLGQPVHASAPGRVIFSGTGIRGFGKLIVIKHNNTYLSVYAHNSELAVKEGQNVTRGQKIAEMGNTDADQVKLHFEIRRLGKPVDPMKLLPAAT